MGMFRRLTLVGAVVVLAGACERGVTDASTTRTPGGIARTVSGCTQSFAVPIIGGATDANLIVDGSFENNCSNWVFTDTFSYRKTGTGSDGTHFAEMKPYTSFTKTRFYQDINLVDPTTGKKALPTYVSYFLNTISSSGSSAFDQFTVRLLNPSTGAVISTQTTQTALVSAQWALYSFHLTQPITAYPNTVRLQVEATVMDPNTRFQFDNMQFWATPGH
jgi:hypothetical protein